MNKKFGLLTFVMLLAAGAMLMRMKPQVSPTEPATTAAKTENETPQSVLTKTAASIQQKISPAPEKIKSIQEIIESDDICALQKWEAQRHKEKNAGPDTSDSYFEQSEFKDNYHDYINLLKGDEPKNNYPRLLYHLSQAGLVTMSDKEIKNIPLNIEKAREGLQTMSQADPKNSALTIFLIAISKGQSRPERDELNQRLQTQDQFDTYLLPYVQDLANADSPSAIGFLIKLDHLADLRIPDWTKVKDQLKAQLINNPDILEKIGWLMANTGLKSKHPTWELGFSALEYSIGKVLLKPSQVLPKFTELNEKIGGRRLAEEPHLLDDIDNNCNEKAAQALRDYVSLLRRENRALNAGI
jgi:hypothetical protein